FSVGGECAQSSGSEIERSRQRVTVGSHVRTDVAIVVQLHEASFADGLAAATGRTPRHLVLVEGVVELLALHRSVVEMEAQRLLQYRGFRFLVHDPLPACGPRE